LRIWAHSRLRREPGYPLQFLSFTAGKASGISASIPCASSGQPCCHVAVSSGILIRKAAGHIPFAVPNPVNFPFFSAISAASVVKFLHIIMTARFSWAKKINDVALAPAPFNLTAHAETGSVFSYDV
jgi:hypothetical protein